MEDLDDAYSLKPKNDFCSKYVKFLIEEEEKKKIMVKDEVKEVTYTRIYYINILYEK